MMVSPSDFSSPSVRYYVDRMEDRWAIYRGSRPLIIYRERERAVARCQALVVSANTPDHRPRIPRIQILHFEAKELLPMSGRSIDLHHPLPSAS